MSNRYFCTCNDGFHYYLTIIAYSGSYAFLDSWREGKAAAEHDDVIKWKHFPALLAICAGNSPVPGEFPTQRPVTRSFDVLFDLRLNKRLSKQSWGWGFETSPRPLWRHSNEWWSNQGCVLVCELNRTPIVMANHGGSCVHFSWISTCGRTSRETVSHPERPPLPTLYKISSPVYVIVTNKRLQHLTTT